MQTSEQISPWAERFYMNRFRKAYHLGSEEIGRFYSPGLLALVQEHDPLIANEIDKTNRELELIWQMADENSDKRDELLAHFKDRVEKLIALWKRVKEELANE